MNSAALGIESGIIEKEINRVVIKTLDEKKSVALWDEPLQRLAERTEAQQDRGETERDGKRRQPGGRRRRRRLDGS